MTIKDCEHEVLEEWLSDDCRLGTLVECIRCPGCGTCYRPTTDGFGMDWYLKETIDPREIEQ